MASATPRLPLILPGYEAKCPLELGRPRLFKCKIEALKSEINTTTWTMYMVITFLLSNEFHKAATSFLYFGTIINEDLDEKGE